MTDTSVFSVPGAPSIGSRWIKSLAGKTISHSGSSNNPSNFILPVDICFVIMTRLSLSEFSCKNGTAFKMQKMKIKFRYLNNKIIGLIF